MLRKRSIVSLTTTIVNILETGRKAHAINRFPRTLVSSADFVILQGFVKSGYIISAAD